MKKLKDIHSDPLNNFFLFVTTTFRLNQNENIFSFLSCWSTLDFFW